MHRPEPPVASNDEPDKIVHLTADDVRDATRLLRLLADAQSHPLKDRGDIDRAFSLSYDPSEGPDLLARAKQILSGRLLRSRHFNPAIFGEPAWEILLVLYITDVSGGRQSLGQLGDWIRTPPTSVLRWVSYLEKEKFLERQPHPTDKRTTFLRLLPKGREAMTAYLSALPR